MKRHLFLAVVVTLIPWGLSAQITTAYTGYRGSYGIPKRGMEPGWVITNTGDTILGYVGDHMKYEFKKDDHSKVQRFDASDYHGYRKGALEYISVNVNMKEKGPRNIFIEVLITGKLSLLTADYVMEPNSGQNVVHSYFVQSYRDPSVYNFVTYVNFLQPKDRHFKLDMARLVEDEPTIAERILNGTYEKKDIPQIVAEYNMLKFKPSERPAVNKGTVVFYKKSRVGAGELFLTINDTIQHAVPGQYIVYVDLPNTIKSKVCFGTNTTKSCGLISTIPKMAQVEYYELQSNGSMTEFDIEKSTPVIGRSDLIDLHKAGVK